MTAAAARDKRGAIRVPAPAKLNLYLHVVGKRADGYHLLDSLVAFASPHDTVEVADADSLRLELAGPFGRQLAAEPDNLVLRAARRLAAASSVEPRAAIKLIKRLPVASGIGGGSADAAATLKALMKLWQIQLPADELAALGLALGADLPVCLHGRAAFVGGIGEELKPAPALPSIGLLLVNPGVALATAAVFRARSGAFGRPAPFTGAVRDAAALAALLAERGNDLAAPAMALCPVIAEVLGALRAVGSCRFGQMSGSGATCFGIFDDEATAQDAAAILGAERPAWWVAAGRLVSDIAGLQSD